MLAHEMSIGDVIEIHPRDFVTVQSVDRRDNSWISNGVVFFTATNGQRYGLNRNALIN